MDEFTAKQAFLASIEQAQGPFVKVARGRSVYEGIWGVRFYMLYSKVHDGYQAFYGIQQTRLDLLSASDSAYIVFLRDEEPSSCTLPKRLWSDLLARTSPAPDGQFKTHLYARHNRLELKLADVDAVDVTRFAGAGGLDDIDPEMPRIPRRK